MSTIFEKNGPDRCCLCGATGKLTGEHKLKASVLASRYKWDEEVAIVSPSTGAKPKFAQSARSKYFHYKAPVCEECNSSRTQCADDAFSKFDAVAQSHIEGNQHPRLAWCDPAFAVGTDGRLQVMRYFAKSLACAIAESDGPRFVALTNFAIGQSDEEVVFLDIDIDPIFERLKIEFADGQYTSHAGLDVSFSLLTGMAENIRSGFTIGPVRYTFYIRMEPLLAYKLSVYDPAFYTRGEKQVQSFGIKR